MDSRELSRPLSAIFVLTASIRRACSRDSTGGTLIAGPADKLTFYIQSDPRGAALYIIRPGDVPEGADVASCYNRGICVY